jgi:hypothetical protein
MSSSSLYFVVSLVAVRLVEEEASLEGESYIPR